MMSKWCSCTSIMFDKFQNVSDTNSRAYTIEAFNVFDTPKGMINACHLREQTHVLGMCNAYPIQFMCMPPSLLFFAEWALGFL